MKRLLLMMLTVATLAACETKNNPVLVADRPVVIIPDDRFFHCPTISNFPNPSTLTDQDIAELLIRLDTNNRQCKRSIEAIRNQLIATRDRINAEGNN